MCHISQMHCTNYYSKHNHNTSSVLRTVTFTIHSQNNFFHFTAQVLQGIYFRGLSVPSHTLSKKYVLNTHEGKN